MPTLNYLTNSNTQVDFPLSMRNPLPDFMESRNIGGQETEDWYRVCCSSHLITRSHVERLLGSSLCLICQQILSSVSGLVVKSIVAIDGPRVRFAADAKMFLFFLVLCFFYRIHFKHPYTPPYTFSPFLFASSFWFWVFGFCLLAEGFLAIAVNSAGFAKSIQKRAALESDL